MTEDADDGALVRRCCDGDRRAFEALVVRYQGTVYNAALRMLHDREEARDVAQTVFMKAYEHLAKYDPKFKFYSWLYRIALNESINALQRRRPNAAFDPDAPDGLPGPEEALGQSQAHASLLRALVSLSTEYRAVIVLRHFTGCSYEDVSDILHVPEKTVKSRLFSARQQLKTALQDEGRKRELGR
jgi:RNA polymerase sigma-70 factor (ECF subfamily)